MSLHYPLDMAHKWNSIRSKKALMRASQVLGCLLSIDGPIGRHDSLNYIATGLTTLRPCLPNYLIDYTHNLLWLSLILLLWHFSIHIILLSLLLSIQLLSNLIELVLHGGLDLPLLKPDREVLHRLVYFSVFRRLTSKVT